MVLLQLSSGRELLHMTTDNNDNITISTHPRYKKPRIYYKGKDSPNYNPDLPKHKGIKIKCACGCGELIPKYDDFGTPHKWKEGHHLEWLHKKTKGVLQGIRTKDEDLTCHRERMRRARYYYFNFYNGKEICIVKDKQICLGPLGMFFIDGNTRNFEKDNLAMMCHAHKVIMKRNKMDLNELKGMKAHFYNTPRSRHFKRRWMVPGKNYHK